MKASKNTLQAILTVEGRIILPVTTRECGLLTRSVACVCVSACNDPTLENLDIKSSLLVCWYIFRIFRSSSYVKVRSRSRSKKRVWALNFEYLEMESSILVYTYSFRISGSSSYIEVIGSRSRSKHVCVSCSRVADLRLKDNLVF